MDVALGEGGQQQLDTLVLPEGLLEAREHLVEHVGVHDAVQLGLVEFVQETLVDSSHVVPLVHSPQGRVEHVVADLYLGVAGGAVLGESLRGRDVRGASDGRVVQVAQHSGRQEAVVLRGGRGGVDVDAERGGGQ